MFISANYKETFSVNFTYKEAEQLLNCEVEPNEEFNNILKKVIQWKRDIKTINTKRLWKR